MLRRDRVRKNHKIRDIIKATTIVVIRKREKVGLNGRDSEPILNMAAERLGGDTSCIEISLSARRGLRKTYKS